MDKHIGVLPVLDEPLVWVGIARVHERQPVPVESVRHRAVQDVNRREGGDGDPVFLVHHARGGVVELLDDDFSGVRRKACDLAALDVPFVGLADVVDEVLGAKLRLVPGRPPHIERNLAGRHPAADPQRGHVAAVVGVKVGEEHLVCPVIRHHGRGEPGDRTGTDIEEKGVAVAELDQPGGRCLRWAEVGHAGAKGGDAHLVVAEDLGLRVVVIPVVVGVDGMGCGLDLAVGDLFVFHGHASLVTRSANLAVGVELCFRAESAVHCVGRPKHGQASFDHGGGAGERDAEVAGRLAGGAGEDQHLAFGEALDEGHVVRIR